MPAKQLALDLAAFLDSEGARSLTGLRPEALRRTAELCLRACYEDVGKKPHLLDEEDVRALLVELLPARLGKADPLATGLPEVFAALLDHLAATTVLTREFELRRALDQHAPGFLETVRAGTLAGQRRGAPQAPIVHRAEKTGRNDPCFCGSGKKFKKCHGR